jgi:hypothetical protein
MVDETMRQELRSALYPNGVKHPQQGEWDWMIEEVKRLVTNNPVVLAEKHTASMNQHAAPQDAVDGGDLVEMVAIAICEARTWAGAWTRACDAEKNAWREDAKAALAAITSLSFDEAVKIADTGLPRDDSEDAIRALTANGDVLIRRE